MTSPDSKALAIRCPLIEPYPNQMGVGCVNCKHYHYCIWFQIYSKLSYIESGVTKVKIHK